MLIGYNLKVAVGTSTMIMTAVAFVGTVSHISMGASVEPIPMLVHRGNGGRFEAMCRFKQ